MNRIRFQPGIQSCSVSLPVSKSIMNRLLVINFLSGGTDIPGLESEAEDISTMQRLLKEISENKNKSDNVFELNTGNAGTVMRFLTAVLAVTPGKWLITGSARMQNRPVRPLTDALIQLGATLIYVSEVGYPPLMITSSTGISGGVVNLDAGISSQFISALMMIGPDLLNGLEIGLQGNIISASYIRMTAELMRKAGAEVTFDGNHIRVSKQHYREFIFEQLSEPDWSAAAFWFEIVALSDNMQVLLTGLTDLSVQGDSVLPAIFANLGVRSIFLPEGLLIEKSGIPAPDEFDYNFTDCPDLAQAVIVSCAALGIKGRFAGLETLRVKETDRIEALRTELNKLGYFVKVEGNLILLEDKNRPTLSDTETDVINCYDDHRMAMAFAPLALVHNNICVDDPAVVKKSYPGFWRDISQLGLILE